MSTPGGETAGTPDAGRESVSEGKAVPAGPAPTDPVDEETKTKAAEEAAEHEDVFEAQRTDATESGGYGH